MCYKIIYGLVDIPLMHFSSLVLALPVAILLNYIILIPESMHVDSIHCQFVLLYYGIVYQLLQTNSIVM